MSDKNAQDAVSAAVELDEGQLDQAVGGGSVGAAEPPDPIRPGAAEPPDPVRTGYQAPPDPIRVRPL